MHFFNSCTRHIRIIFLFHYLQLRFAVPFSYWENWCVSQLPVTLLFFINLMLAIATIGTRVFWMRMKNGLFVFNRKDHKFANHIRLGCFIAHRTHTHTQHTTQLVCSTHKQCNIEIKSMGVTRNNMEGDLYSLVGIQNNTKQQPKICVFDIIVRKWKTDDGKKTMYFVHVFGTKKRANNNNNSKQHQKAVQSMNGKILVISFFSPILLDLYSVGIASFFFFFFFHLSFFVYQLLYDWTLVQHA